MAAAPEIVLVDANDQQELLKDDEGNEQPLVAKEEDSEGQKAKDEEEAAAARVMALYERSRILHRSIRVSNEHSYPVVVKMTPIYWRQENGSSWGVNLSGGFGATAGVGVNRGKTYQVKDIAQVPGESHTIGSGGHYDFDVDRGSHVQVEWARFTIIHNKRYVENPFVGYRGKAYTTK